MNIDSFIPQNNHKKKGFNRIQFLFLIKNKKERSRLLGLNTSNYSKYSGRSIRGLA